MHRFTSCPACLLGAAVMLVLPLACADTAEEEANQPPAAETAPSLRTSLYDRLGGEAAVQAVVDDFVARAAADESLNFTRAGTEAEWEATPENVERLKHGLVTFVASATGGPQTYEGEDMRTVHDGMEITNAEFDKLAGHLRAALEENAVPADLQQELLATVESTRAAIVTAESSRAPAT